MASKLEKDLKGKKSAKLKKAGKTPLGELARSERYDFSYTQNREISWLRFDDRVLSEAYDETVPLFERLKFAAIFQSNLDEFFMIRIGGLSDLATLKHQPVDNKSNLTPSEQIDKVFEALPPLYARQARAFHELEEELADRGMVRLEPSTLIGDERTFGKKIGGDILCGKRTFLLINALKNGSVSQRQTIGQLLKNGGIPAEEKIAAVTAIYDSLDMPKVCADAMEEYYSRAMQALSRITDKDDAEKAPFVEFARSLMGRTE